MVGTLEFMQQDSAVRGGKRRGAGRPTGTQKRPATVTMRVPEGTAEIVRSYAKKTNVAMTVAVAELIEAGAKAGRMKRR